jgi:hypothetical protein
MDHLPYPVLLAVDNRHSERSLLLPDPEAHPVIDRPAHFALLIGHGITWDEFDPGLALTHERVALPGQVGPPLVGIGAKKGRPWMAGGVALQDGHIPVAEGLGNLDRKVTKLRRRVHRRLLLRSYVRRETNSQRLGGQRSS